MILGIGGLLFNQERERELNKRKPWLDRLSTEIFSPDFKNSVCLFEIKKKQSFSKIG